MQNLRSDTRKGLKLRLAAWCVLLAGCQVGLVLHYENLRTSMAAGDYGAAADQMSQQKDQSYRKRDRVLFLLDRGTLLHYANRFSDSSKDFVSAEAAMRELFTKSVRHGVASMLSNPTVTQYPGEDFEQILLYLYTAINHITQRQIEPALVEVRRADDRLRAMETFYEQEGGIGTIYTRDAFLHWLNGMLFEEEGSHNDALISFRLALETYEQDYGPHYGTAFPSYLSEDILRAASRVGFPDVVADFRARGATGESGEQLKTSGEFIAIIGLGESPLKTDQLITSVLPGPPEYLLRVAIPQFNAIPSIVQDAEIQAHGMTARSVLVEDVTGIALNNYLHRLPKITAQAMARAASKYAATQALRVAGEVAEGESEGALGEVIGLMANVVGVVTEQADKRSWRTLPGRFHVARLMLPPGVHDISVAYRGASGEVIAREVIRGVEIRVGQRSFRSIRCIQ